MALDLAQFASRIRVLDGAYGTQFQKHGLAAGACPELWNIENPDPVIAVTRAYVEAGSEVVITNTFGANRFILAQHDAQDRVAELAEAGAALARSVAGNDVTVFGSIGPSGKIVMMGDVTEEDLHATFTDAAMALERGGVNAIILETFNELAEVKIALEAAKRATALPVICSMTYTAGGDMPATMMGNRPAELAALAEELGADGVGANCGLGPDGYVEVAREYRQATDLPIWIKANAGLPEIVAGQTTFPMGPEEFVEYVRPLIDAGANFIGGCCGTGPDYIRLIRQTVDDLIP
jgi:5-methyltetrahydrofolate--homocysteine methyltransferase